MILQPANTDHSADHATLPTHDRLTGVYTCVYISVYTTVYTDSLDPPPNFHQPTRHFLTGTLSFSRDFHYFWFSGKIYINGYPVAGHHRPPCIKTRKPTAGGV